MEKKDMVPARTLITSIIPRDISSENIASMWMWAASNMG
eukprot:CAMPEP_0173400438 /NCGR_PEP_ID=MMETSP1356-20130122/47913_1 /TAXON_ID=77927 ORGANISM="Hemiselmis virescens, Strain PCC157" /NCGR_SAMPLE_ID=MMETSP1356 /ASSEMBLY_ACC=CAM_ASM_000847 /LENGTH=38 /DNA_ID= /DNA_START= /DNA_END= /DNA_ORIENTATION=